MYIHEIGRIDALPNGAADDRRRSACPATAPIASAAMRRHDSGGPAGTARDAPCTATGPDARAAAAVRDAERLVQVEVRHVGAELARRGEADERVQVRAVDVHLAAVRVDDLADAHDAGLEHAVRRRIGDHDRGEVARVRVGLRLEVGEVDVAVVVAARRRPPACPTICADAGLVPCADAGIRHTLRCASPRLA